ncbi:hypothetical protein HMPREF9371_0241 [Neisseria shayeganii 871]|uniref:Uncharacterized protein n=1 Tax=Neisseria shayeganii 871 TaxID=1032488 RepID=G4CF52_9NEIS|nr:hypothetical protein HMPREF9371_0241 [Neisseria shayeganii 871]
MTVSSGHKHNAEMRRKCSFCKSLGLVLQSIRLPENPFQVA